MTNTNPLEKILELSALYEKRIEKYGQYNPHTFENYNCLLTDDELKGLQKSMADLRKQPINMEILDKLNKGVFMYTHERERRDNYVVKRFEYLTSKLTNGPKLTNCELTQYKQLFDLLLGTH